MINYYIPNLLYITCAYRGRDRFNFIHFHQLRIQIYYFVEMTYLRFVYLNDGCAISAILVQNSSKIALTENRLPPYWLNNKQSFTPIHPHHSTPQQPFRKQNHTNKYIYIYTHTRNLLIELIANPERARTRTSYARKYKSQLARAQSDHKNQQIDELTRARALINEQTNPRRSKGYSLSLRARMHRSLPTYVYVCTYARACIVIIRA